MNLSEALGGLEPIDRGYSRMARGLEERLTKPPGSLGKLEDVAIQVAGIMRSERPQIRGKTVIVAAGDHGVVAQGVTGYPQAVTGQMVLNFLSGRAAVTAMARHGGVKVVVVDAGVASELPAHPELRSLRMGRGTADMTQGPAMRREEAERCLEYGIQLAREAVADGADLIGLGDMGIGNTTASSAIAAAVTGASPEVTTGKGTGRSQTELAYKVSVVRRALALNHPDGRDGVDVLTKVGGFEIGVLAGVAIGGAVAKRPVVLDGFISGAVALVACAIAPEIRGYLIASHRSAERGHRVMLRHLRLRPLLDLKMRLGEGTGAVLAMGVVEAAVACLSEMATFDEAGVMDRIRD